MSAVTTPGTRFRPTTGTSGQISARGSGRSRWRRRRNLRFVLAGLLIALAPFVGHSGNQELAPVVTVTRDLPDGHILTATDISSTTLSASAAPDGATTGTESLIGGRLTGGMRRGEILTDQRVSVSDGKGSPRSDRRVVPIPLADAAVASLLTPGDVIDLVAPTDSGSVQAPGPMVRAAEVVEVPPGKPGGARTILVSVPETEAATLAATAVGMPLAIMVH